MSYVLGRPRRRRRAETIVVIVLTALLAVCGATVTAVAVTLSSKAPAIVSAIR